MNIESISKLLTAGIGAGFGYLFGGWDTLIQALIIFAVIDYITGMIAGGVTGQLKSKVGLIGILKKVLVFLAVGVAVQLDIALETNSAFRDATIFFFLGNELLSILENFGRAGVPIPEPLANAVEVLRGKSEKKTKGEE